MKKKKTIKAKDFDEKFERGDDLSDFLDLDSSIQRVNVDFPVWMIQELDKESKRLGVSRQAIIKTWIGDKLDSTMKKIVGE